MMIVARRVKQKSLFHGVFGFAQKGWDKQGMGMIGQGDALGPRQGLHLVVQVRGGELRHVEQGRERIL